MKKEVFLFAVILVYVLVLISADSISLGSGASITGNVVTGDTVTGKSITGNVTAATASLTITVTAPPNLALIYPQNKTYLSNQSIKLNYTSLSADFVWYKLDSDSNITITGNTTINVSNGLHTLYLWANNSYGNSSDSIVFTANNTRFIILYNNYYNNGSSTDFNESTSEDIQNLSDVILEKSTYGKIAFGEAVNMTDDLANTDNLLDLDSNTNISSNFIDINITALPNFNKSARLSLYNLAFANPRVLRNGGVCPSEICTEVSYTGNTFIFDVTQFTNYSSEETPEEIPVTPPVTGGPSGGGARYLPLLPKKELFSIDKSQISVTLIPGQIKAEEITITNNLDKAIAIGIENLFEEHVLREEDAIVLNPGESKKITLNIFARIDTVPDLYLGKIIIKSENVEKEVLIAVEVESEGVLLDVRAKIEESHKIVLPGESILAEIRLFNLGFGGDRKDVYIEYIIRDFEGKDIIKETESLAIETQLTFIKEMEIPDTAECGNYVLYIRATTPDGKMASATDNFEVVETKVTENEKVYIVIIILLICILSWVIYYLRKRNKERLSKIKKAKPEDLIKRGK